MDEVNERKLNQFPVPLLDLKTARAVRYFCWTVGTVALLYLVLALVLAVVLGRAVITGDVGDTPTLDTTAPTLSSDTPDGICPPGEPITDPDCPSG